MATQIRLVKNVAGRICMIKSLYANWKNDFLGLIAMQINCNLGEIQKIIIKLVTSILWHGIQMV